MDATVRKSEAASATRTGVVIVLALLLLLALGATRSADAEVPSTADFAACNEHALQAVKAGTASPIRGDHARAERARSGAVTANPTDFVTKGIESPDPQIHGMEAEGAKSAAFQAGYRGCMRRKGF